MTSQSIKPNFEVDKVTRNLIRKAAYRFGDIHENIRKSQQDEGVNFSDLIDEWTSDMQINVEMTLRALMNSTTPIDLKKLNGFDDFNFIHDITGISEHINTDTGELEGFFVPRSAS